MEVRSVKRYGGPAYPDKDASLREPALLPNAPERWKRNAAVCAALAATSAMLLSSCEPASGEAAVPVPFFEHGDGRGSFGCVSVAPPVFLSEAEAFEVIGEVAVAEGLAFERNGMQLKGIDLPVTNIYDYEKDGVLGVKKGTLLLDGVSDEKNVAFEFISTEDIDNWQKKINIWSSVSDYDFIETAKTLSKSLNEADTGMAVAVFYDPNFQHNDQVKELLDQSISDEERYREAAENLKEMAREDLRAQVRDFIAWLKAQGII